MTGLVHARGELVFLLDSDLEEEPELLQKFYDELNHTGADVVFGVQEQRKGNCSNGSVEVSISKSSTFFRLIRFRRITLPRD